jgi:PST family polysaccharide transporter
MRDPPPAAPHSEGLRSAAIRGAGWLIGLSGAARVVGLSCTLVITYFLNPATIGEASLAVVLALTAGQLSNVGLGQYFVSHPGEGKKLAWHVLVLHVVLGAVAFGVMLQFRHELADLTHSASVASYLPWLALGLILDRIAFVPERVATRDLRFRRVAVIRSIGELTYGFSSVGLAMLGFGGMAIVYGNLARSSLRSTLFFCSVKPGEWIAPTRLEWAICKRLLAFGLPLSLGTFVEYAVSRFDNLLFAHLFGPAVMGEYNLAYNLADAPADQIGEQIAEVLVPSLARLEPGKRRRALVSATGMVSMVVFPLAIGFGVVADTAVRTLLPPRWWGVGPMLSLLCALSVARPISWELESYLVVLGRTRSLTLLQVGRLCTLVALVLALGRFGPLWACAGVGVAFGGHALGTMCVISRADGTPVRGLLSRCWVATIASGVMVAAVIGMRRLLALADVDVRGLNLVVEIATGALVYVLACVVVGPSESREFLRVARTAIERRRASEPPIAAHQS